MKFILFADDTNIVASNKNPEYLSYLVNTETNKVSTWFKANKLSLNIKKTSFILFKSHKRANYKLDLVIDDIKIRQTSQTSFLGAIIDEHLTWNPHINHITTKLLNQQV